MEESQQSSKNIRLLIKWYQTKRLNEIARNYNHEAAWESIQNKIHARKRKIIILQYLKVAACIISLLSIGLIGYYKLTSTNNLFLREGGHEAILYSDSIDYQLQLGKETIINLDKVVAESNEGTLRYKNTAASPSIPQILRVPKGNEYNIILSDGTLIHANNNTKLTYPSRFDTNTREVYIDGEAYFEVAKDSLRPFYVHTPLGTIEVLGTQFNVKTSGQNHTWVTLKEGSVKIISNTKYKLHDIILHPGQQARITTDSILRLDVPIHQYISWKDGIYEYDHTDLGSIVHQLSEWYNVDIRFTDPTLQQRTFAGVILRNKPLKYAVDILSKVSDVRFKQVGNHIEIYAESN